MSLSPADRILGRIEHAGAYVQEFYRRRALFLHPQSEREPYEVVGPELNRKGTHYLMRLHIHERPPLELELIVGDVVHNLRAALDNLVWATWKRRRPRRLAFPTTHSEIEWIEWTLEFLVGQPDDLYWVINELQPYHRPDHPERHPAAILNRLWNRDKHKFSPIGYALAQAGGFGVTYDQPNIPAWKFELGPMKDRQVVACCPVDPNADMSIEPRLGIEVAIEDSGAEPWLSAAQVVDDLYNFVRDKAYPAFLPFLK